MGQENKMQCEMCGKDSELFRALVEGTEMNVCRECTSFGKVLKKIVPPSVEKKKIQIKVEEEPEIVQMIAHDYASIVKKARESAGLKQEELAKKLNEKESIIHKIETGHYKPNLAVARKLEKFLNIKLVEEHKVEKTEKTSSDSGSVTIGDLLKLKK